MAGENHLTYFKVENFKRFKELEVKDIGQFNLVLGDNNVGKTSFLEALLSLYSRQSVVEYLAYLVNAMKFRNLEKADGEMFFQYFINVESFHEKKTGAATFFFDEVMSEPGFSLEFDVNSNSKNVKYKRLIIENGITYPSSDSIDFDAFLSNSSVSPQIPMFQGYASDLTEFYGKNLQRDIHAKEKFFDSIRKLFPDVIRLEPTAGLIRGQLILDVQLKDLNYTVPLAFFGEGIIKLTRILASLIIFSKKIVLIDEIDTGIHYSRMKDFWKTILLAAKENDVQLFTTTHNLECIRYFKEALEEVDLVSLQKEARSITLVENSKTKEITAHTFSFEALEHSIDAGNEIRSF
jgi:AAA15 family ATPase/GTPase